MITLCLKKRSNVHTNMCARDGVTGRGWMQHDIVLIAVFLNNCVSPDTAQTMRGREGRGGDKISTLQA